MPRLDTIFSQKGPPPPEICLEWAWQLQQLVDNDLQRRLAWHEVRLSANYQLAIEGSSNTAAADHDSTAADLIQQLIAWSGYADEDSHSDVDDAQLLARATRELVVRKPTPVPAGVARRKHNSSPSRTTIPPHSVATSRSPKTSLGTRGILIGSGLLLVPMVWWSTTALLRTEATLAQSSQSNPGAEQTAARKTVLNNNEALRQGRSASLVAEPKTPTVGSDPSTLVLSNASETESSDLSLAVEMPGVQTLEQLGSNIDLTRSITATDVLDTATPSVASSAESGSAPSDNVTGASHLPASLDVLDEVKKMVAAASNAEPNEPSTATSGSLPISISTYPPRSIHRFKESKSLSVSQPQWQLRLDVPEELVVTPATAQTLTGRESIAWRIELDAGQAPITAVHVAAQLVNPRSTDIRWSVVAMADDLPQVVLPVGREMLDPLQSQLGRMNQQLNGSIDGLRAQSRVVGIPSATRGELNRQRRELESQLEIGQRLLQVVADANQMSGLLGSQLAVHAQLDDARQPNSTGLLQFGSIDATPLDSNSTEIPSTVE